MLFVLGARENHENLSHDSQIPSEFKLISQYFPCTNQFPYSMS
jgi:hypothetical protein